MKRVNWSNMWGQLGKNVVIAVLAVSICCTAAASSSERDIVIARLTSLYGHAIETEPLLFAISAHYVLHPTFSADGALTVISIEARDNPVGTRRALPKRNFHSILSKLDSIKHIGTLEETPTGADRSGWRITTTKRFQNAYITVSEWQSDGSIESATVHYIR